MNSSTYSTTYFNPPTPALTNSVTNVIFDTTYGFMSTASTSTVGSHRARYARHRIGGYISCTTQDVTLRLDYLTSAGAWDSTAAKSVTVTAGTPYPFDWLPAAADWRLVEVNGGTGPSALTFNGVFITNNPESGA